MNPHFLYLIVLFLFCFTPCAAQEGTSMVLQHFTTEHGLPSTEVYDVIQDDKGYIWIITDNGVSRYDGYGFKNFGLDIGFSDIVITQVRKGRDGKLWFNCLNNKLFLLDDGQIIPYEYNDVLEKYPVVPSGLNLSVDTVFNKVYLGYLGAGIIEIDENGRDSFYSLNASGFLVKQFNSKFHGIQISANLVDDGGLVLRKKENIGEKNTSLLFWESDKVNKKIPIGLESARKHFTQIGRDSVLLCFDKTLYLVVEGAIRDEVKIRSTPNKILKKNNQLYFCLSDNGGLVKYNSIADLFAGNSIQIMKDESVSSCYWDKQDGFWISTLKNGIYLCANLNFEILNLDSPKETVLAFSESSGKNYGLTSRGGVLRLDKQKYIGDVVKRKEILETGDIVMSSGENFYGGEEKDVFFQDRKYTLNIKRVYLNKDETLLIVLNATGMWINDLKDESLVFNSSPEKWRRYNCLHEVKKDVALLGGMDGLYLLDFKDWSIKKYNKYEELINVRVEDIGNLDDSTIVIGTKGRGVFVIKGNEVKCVSKHDGLTSDFIERIHIDEKNRIWTATLEGANLIEWAENKWQCYQIVSGSSLPSNEVYDITTKNDTTWITTAGGLVRLNTKVLLKIAKKPLIERILINGKANNIFPNLTLPHNQNDIQIEYKCLDIHRKGKIDYRYRIKSDNEWIETNSTRLNFSGLASSDYLIEIQAKGLNGEWSDSATFPFHIATPFWKTWLFWIAVTSLIGWLIRSYYRKQLRQLTEKNKMQAELLELENAAKQAQMNPHFIFNSLNSIQGLISEGDQINAMRYLHKFSDLIRFSLKASLEKTMELGQIIQFLNDYMQLEQVRHRDKFEYSFQIEERLKNSDIKLPSLLIQPFLENAIIHGVLKKEEGMGQITLILREVSGYLEVTIKDNGLGLNSHPKDEKKHLSVATDLIKKRLALWNRISNSSDLSISNYADDEGAVGGVVVKFRVWLRHLD